MRAAVVRAATAAAQAQRQFRGPVRGAFVPALLPALGCHSSYMPATLANKAARTHGALQRLLGAALRAAYGDAAWQLVPQSFALPSELSVWKQQLDELAAAGQQPGPVILKTAQHLGKVRALGEGGRLREASSCSFSKC